MCLLCGSHTPKQIDLTSIFVTIQLPYFVIMLLLTSGYKLSPAQLKHRYYLAPPLSLSRKQIKIKPMLCNPLFIVHIRVKGLFKVILEYKNETPQLKK